MNNEYPFGCVCMALKSINLNEPRVQQKGLWNGLWHGSMYSQVFLEVAHFFQTCSNISFKYLTDLDNFLNWLPKLIIYTHTHIYLQFLIYIFFLSLYFAIFNVILQTIRVCLYVLLSLSPLRILVTTFCPFIYRTMRL